MNITPKCGRRLVLQYASYLILLIIRLMKQHDGLNEAKRKMVISSNSYHIEEKHGVDTMNRCFSNK